MLIDKIDLPRQINDILNVLVESGYEGYLVGGAIRDYYLNLKPDDYDIATNATVDDMKRLFAGYKIIETGIKHGTVLLVVDDIKIEITTYRDESKTLKGDLLLRDFTINSIAYSPKKGIIDYYNGLEDINNKIIRLNGDDDGRFKEDPLRILRAIRLAAMLNFKIDEKTKNYIFKVSNLLNNVSVERLNDEFTKILLSAKPSIYIREYFTVFTVFIPEIQPLKNFKQNNPHHIYDCLEHTLIVLDNVESNIIMRLAALFHDSGKPHTYTEDEKHIGHFYDHYKVSIELAKKVLKRLKYDYHTIDRVTNIIYYHDYPLTLTTKSIKKLLNYFGTTDIYNLLDLKRADTLGQNLNYISRLDEIEQARSMIEEMINKKECFSLNDLKVKGSDLIIIGITDGKEIGNILKQLLYLVIAEAIPNDYDILIERAKKIKR